MIENKDQEETTPIAFPPSFNLRYTLHGGESVINRIAWSPDGTLLATPTNRSTICLWSTDTGKLYRTFKEAPGLAIGYTHTVAWSPGGRTLASGGEHSLILWNSDAGNVQRVLARDHTHCVAWSPDGHWLASLERRGYIRLWDTRSGQFVRRVGNPDDGNDFVQWSPDGNLLAMPTTDNTLLLWNAQDGRLHKKLSGHSGNIHCLTWSPDGHFIVSGSDDHTICLWDAVTGRQVRILEGHTASIVNIAFSYDGRLLVSKARDDTIHLWDTNTWETVVTFKVPHRGYPPQSGLAFHPHLPLLATLGENGSVVYILELDMAAILGTTKTPMTHYVNAKIVLVGDSGVGKSGLGLVLAGQSFAPTESTHGRHVWTIENKEIKLRKHGSEIRETLLWDLAGQPGYRLIHQLHLNEVTVALVVFDSRSETDPFAGVEHWLRALNLAYQAQGNTALPLKKILVAARIDRGGKSVSHTRIEALVQEYGFSGYFETSAREGWGITQLIEAIKKAINWKMLPKVSSTSLFQIIKTFLIGEKEAGRLLTTRDDLYRAFLNSKSAPEEFTSLRSQFETCIGRLESRGLIRRLSFGSLVLLQPELLDAYASALINAVRDEPDGLGSIAEEKTRNGQFLMSEDERIKDKDLEKLLLIAMVEDLLRYEIALREGSYLVFPSQSTRENPNIPDPEGKTVIFRFEGSVMSIYTTLAVRLAHSGIFRKKELWKNAITYKTSIKDVICGICLHNSGEGCGELTLFFSKATSTELRVHFEEYVRTHLERRSLPGSLEKRRIFICNQCETPFTDIQIKRRRELGFEHIRCSVCDTEITLADKEEKLIAASSSIVLGMNQTADTNRERDTASAILHGKIETNDFDVFLCHNSIDILQVKKIGESLKDRGILPWLDTWEARPGIPWQSLLEEQISNIKAAAVFIGKSGIGPWQQQEIYAILNEFTKRNCPVIPVLLEKASEKPVLPIFLRSMTWIDFNKKDVAPLDLLVWGITGRRN